MAIDIFMKKVWKWSVLAVIWAFSLIKTRLTEGRLFEIFLRFSIAAKCDLGFRVDRL